MIFWSIRAVSKSPTRTTSSPGPPPRSKWRSKKPLAKAAEILQEWWSILSRDTWWNGFFGGCFQRLVALFVFLQSETVVQTKRRHFIVFSWQNCNEFLEPFWQPWPGVSQTAILNEVATRTQSRTCVQMIKSLLQFIRRHLGLKK